MGHGQANPSPRAFRNIGVDCAPQDPTMKSRLLGVDSNCPSRPSFRDDFELSRLFADDFEMSRLSAGDSKIRRLWESARDSNHLLPSPRWTGRSTVAAWPSLPRLRGDGMATVHRIAGDLHHGPALSPCLPRPQPQWAAHCAHDGLPVRPGDGGTARQRENRRRRERPEDGPVGVGPLESASPSHRPRTALNRQDGEWRQ